MEKNKRTLGFLEGKATCVIRPDFKMTTEELLGENKKPCNNSRIKLD